MFLALMVNRSYIIMCVMSCAYCITHIVKINIFIKANSNWRYYYILHKHTPKHLALSFTLTHTHTHTLNTDYICLGSNKIIKSSSMYTAHGVVIPVKLRTVQ